MAALGLGTVQFGLTYGIANARGRPDQTEVSHILALARAGGATVLDTAITYGDSETVLGRAGITDWQVVSKLPAIPEGLSDITGWMQAQVAGSLVRLGITRLYGLLLHDPTQMHGPGAAAITRALEDIAAQGLATRVGVSIQRPYHDLPAVLAHMTPGLIQAPFNLLDDALVTQGWAARLRGMGCEIHTRSAFLQGLLVMDPKARPPWFDRWADHWQVWQDWQDATGLRAPDACLRFVRAQPDIDCCIVGVDSAAQMRTLLDAGAAPLPSRPRWPGLVGPDLITPSRWPVS